MARTRSTTAASPSTLGSPTITVMSKTPAPRPSAAKPAAPAAKPSRDQVAKRAYEIWLAKGRPLGQDEQNWLQAERELAKR